jgi:alpha-D-xyloside xylohydrolase
LPKTYEIPTFLGQSVPVEMVARLQDVTANGSSVLLRCVTNRYEPHMHNYYGTCAETTFHPPETGTPATVQLDFCTQEIMRLRYFPGSEIPAVQTPMVVGRFEEQVEVRVSESQACLTLETDALRVVVVREPWQLTVYDKEGDVIWTTRPVDLEPLRHARDRSNPTEQRWKFYHRYAYPLGVTRDTEQVRVFASWDLHYDEHIYGFGENYGRLDKWGTQQRLWLQEVFSNAVPVAYKQVPFFVSTRGYGMYVNTSNAVGFHVGNLEHTAISVIVDDTALLDLYLIYGPSLMQILPRYTAITGAPAVPPKWTFGLWMSRISYNRQDQVETVARDLREHRIPCDVIHIDTDWFEREWECDLKFGKEKFRDPHGMIAKLREQSFRVCLWQWPNMIVGSPMYKEGRDNGYLAKRENGHPYIFSGFEEDAGFIDYSNPEAVEWVKGKFRELFNIGVAAIKTDFGEGAPPDAVYHSVPSESMHNLYPLLYNKAVFEVTEECLGPGKAVVWSRSAWAGSQRYPVHWSGDGIARYEDLACVLRSALNFGLSGFPFYSHDIGGFAGIPSPDLYVRWAQFGLFSSHSRCHGWPPREPWTYGEQAERIFRQYDELRYRLMPYIYSEARECGRSSLPMLRALVLAYQADPTTHTIEDQYLFGRSILVAPILDERNHRRVYLPHGWWIDYWTKQILEGGRWLEVDAPLDTLPLYVKAGAIIPYGPRMQYIDEHPPDPLTLEIYAPETEGAYMIEDEDRSDIRVEYRKKGGTFTVDVGAAPGQVELVVYGVEVTGAEMDGTALEMEMIKTGGTRVFFDGSSARTVTLQIESEG